MPMHRNHLKHKATILLVAAMLIPWNLLPAQTINLFTEGKTDYVILVSKGASPNCNTAVAELRSYLHRITGTQIQCVHEMPAKGYVAFEEGTPSDGSFDVRRLNDDGFRLRTTNNNIYITARTGQGLINAVYTFLDDYLGCRYYATNAVHIPHRQNISLPQFDDIQNPALIYRTTPFGNARDAHYAAWHKLTGSGNQRRDWGLFVHTMHKFVSPEEYFDTHPEYYALRNGVRVKDQLCLAHPDVLKITVERLKQMIAANPKPKYWSVSQMDNYQFCQCDKCRAIDSAEGSPSGSIIHFVNKVAAHFPDKVIWTLAYQYSRKAPLHIKPATNVNIMLCTIECDRSKPLEADTSADGFYHDLKAWANITDSILVWDYVVNFSHLVAPFPNFHVLKPNINLFVTHHATMIFEQGHPAPGAEFNELRCYLICKLMWNPNADVDKLMDDFLTGYYGPAGRYLRQYIDLETRNLTESGKALTLYEPPITYATGYLSPKRLHEYFGLLAKALEAVKDDPTYRQRVETALQSVRYAWLEVCKYRVFSDDWIFAKGADGKYQLKPQAGEMLDTFYKTTKQFGNQRLNEKSLNADSYYKLMNDYFTNGVVNHLAVGRKITFEKPCSDKYRANGPNSLIDGVRGTEDYQVLWQGWLGDDVNATIDLMSSQPVACVEVTCLDDNLSWIVSPESLSVGVSEDGQHYTPAASCTNPNAGKKMDRQIVKFSLPFKQPVQARYIKVNVKNLGKLPPWRGVDDKAWLFVDEIVVK